MVLLTLMPDQLPPAPLLELTSRPDLGILVGRWRQQSAQPSALRRSYQQLADQALATGCRFWLQDLRRRVSPDQDTKRWLLDEYYPAVARRLGGRLFVAYLFSPAMHRQIVEAPDYAPPEAYNNAPYALDFFGDEGAAIHWLQAHQPAR